ncbi:hypothetical protein [Sphingomonas hengshuiensis]|uniref:Uncharacterized protein n=1 Tax=Sphingomonas hengshuiensis TaxID=1609977 RepID=A0A7U5BE87_9SPHN|nr:hypothetical protein [Sphingomonas hengshuiensis]AJP70647.1 hypothetical protein TS85_00560 [Sphingomonas hengshuiensis]
MARVLMGGLLGGVAMWIVGFLFWGTPLSRIALSRTDDPASAALQRVLADNLGTLGTGAYPVPWPGTPAGTQLHGQGPVVMVFFNANGFAIPDSSALIGGLVLAIVCALLVAVAIRTVANGASFGARLKLVAVIAVAVTAYTDLGQPIYNHMPLGYFLFLWISDVASWIAAGAVIAWALPRTPILRG